MEDLLVYMAKTAIGLTAFYAAFRLLFMKSSDFRFNRIYLLFSLLIALIIPAISFTVTREAAPTQVFLGASAVQVTSPGANSPKGISWISLAGIFYLAGVVVLAGRLLHGHLKALRMVSRSKISGGSIPLYIYPGIIHPFAFFNKIVIPTHLEENSDLPLIVRHEQVHVRELHWLDNLTAEIICIIQWFNPAAWLLKSALKSNLEYLADEETISNHDPVSYQMALLSLASTRSLGTFLTAINSSNLKTRITMMNQKTKTSFRWLRRGMLLPLLAILTASLSGREYKTIVHADPLTFQASSAVVPADQIGIPVNEAAVPSPANAESDVNKSVQQHETNAVSPVDTSKNSMGNMAADPLYIVNGKEFKGKIADINVDEIESVSVLKGNAAAELYGEKFTEGVIVIETKAVKSNEKDPLIMVNGEIYNLNINTINPDNIASIDVMKGESATNLYGAKGKNGVIWITMKENTPLSSPVNSTGSRSVEIRLQEKNGQTVNSSGKLRQHIARGIKYPVAAQEAGQEGSISLFMQLDQDGTIVRISDTEPDTPFETMDEVVIVSYRSATAGQPNNDSLKLLIEESKRVMRTIPKIDIPELNGKWVKLQFNFALQ
jgi:TonB-dependent SusC/RagA subfamily outer membrane receptor